MSAAAKEVNPHFLRKKWNRMRSIYMRIGSMKIGDYSADVELEIAEYFKLRKELKGF